MSLAGQNALVTGGGTGIGAAIARALAAEGAKVIVVGRRQAPLDAIAKEVGGTAIVADVSRLDDIDQVIRGTGPFSILVNNAGLAQSAPFAKVSEETWRETMAVNLDAVFHCSQAVLPGMIKVGSGRIVTVASTAGLRGFAYTAPYVAAKHGAIGLMRALAVEFAGKGITFNAICPGFTDTDIVATAVRTIRARTGRSEGEARAGLARLNQSGRLITPAEVAEEVIALVRSDRTGEAVEIS